MIELLFLLQATVSTPPIVVVVPTYPIPERQTAPIPASAKAVVDHIDAIWKGDIQGSLAFVAEDVAVSISDGTKTVKDLPSGKETAQIMYLAMTRKGLLGASAMGCNPEAEFVRCTLAFGAGKDTRNFTMRYYADGGPITRILSWESHGKVAR